MPPFSTLSYSSLHNIEKFFRENWFAPLNPVSHVTGSAGICTRRPLLLQLINPHKKEWDEGVDEVTERKNHFSHHSHVTINTYLCEWQATGEAIWTSNKTGAVVKEEPEEKPSDFKGVT